MLSEKLAGLEVEASAFTMVKTCFSSTELWDDAEDTSKVGNLDDEDDFYD